MAIAKTIRDNIASRIEQYPALYLRAQAIYHRRPTIKGNRLRCVGKGKCVMEAFSDLGPGEDQVQVKTIGTALNTGTELAHFLRLKNTNAEFPYTPSASGVGTIVKTGKKADRYKVGDLVVGPFIHSSMQTLDCNLTAKISPSLNLQNASLIHLAVIAMQGIRMGRINDKTPMRIVVLGQGVIGRLTTLITRAMGNEVLCITRTKEKLARLGEETGTALEEIETRTQLEKLKADVVIDASGNPEAIHDAILIARSEGRIVLLGSNRGQTRQFDLNGLVKEKCLSIVGAHIHNLPRMPQNLGLTYQGEVNYLQDLIKSGELSLSKSITHNYKAQNLAGIYQEVLPNLRDSCGVVIDWCDIDKFQSKNVALLKGNSNTPKVSDQLRMALVGCGAIGDTNAQAIMHSSFFTLDSVVDKDILKAKSMGEKYRVDYSDKVEEIINNESIDAVFIALPHYLHAPIAKQFTEAKKHILIEKPLAISIEQAKAMIIDSQKNNVLLLTNLSFAFQEEVQKTKQLVDFGVTGRVFGISMEFHRYRGQDYWYEGTSGRFLQNWRGIKQQSGGGVVMMNLIHAIDCLLYMTNIKIKTVYAQCNTFWHPVETEDTASIIIEGENGETGTISASNIVRGSKGDRGGRGGDLLRIWGESGQIILENNTLQFYSLRPIGKYKAQHWHQLKSSGAINHRATFLDHFGQKIKEGVVSDFEERGFVSLAIVLAIYKSAELGKPVKIEEIIGE